MHCIVQSQDVENPKINLGASDKNYTWETKPIKLKVPLTSHIQLYFYYNCLHWKTITVDTHCDFAKQQIAHDEWLYIVYVNKKTYDSHYGGLMLQVTITKIALQFTHETLTMQRFAESENHRVIAVVNSTTIGRAQNIYTTGYGETRTYTWEFNEQMGSDVDDSASLISPLISPKKIPWYEPDSDFYSNNNTTKPILLSEPAVLRIQFHNLKYKPPPFVEHTIRWSEFFVKKPFMDRFKRRSSVGAERINTMHITLTKELSCYIYYMMLTEGSFQIVRIAFIAKRYLQSLQVMGADVAPKTI